MDFLIYDQKSIPKDRWRYGLRSVGATGCGPIAAYNALCLLGYHPKMEPIVRWFERNVPLINGNLGTFVLTPAQFFKKLGFPVRVITRRSGFDEAARSSDVCLLFYRWQKKLKGGAHYVALQYKNGRFTGYNTYRNAQAPDDYGESLEAFLKKRKYFFTVLIAVKAKAKETAYE
ncbi:MAG: hypothetical protein IJO88_00930 [Oscillospiraceae bacterium]|nr:hypothetical protein [Oscillospiraceae bacterium]